MRASLDEVVRWAEQQGILLSKDLAYRLVHDSARERDLELGRRVQSLLAGSALESVSIFANHLIRLFASCGRLLEANQALNKITKPDDHTWQAIIDSHANLEGGETAFLLYNTIQQIGTKPNNFTFTSILKACRNLGALDQGRHIHEHIVEDGLQCDRVIGSSLVDMYAKCGRLNEALAVFSTLPERDVVTWGAMIGAFAQNDEGMRALQCFVKMQEEKVKPTKFVFSSVLKACGHAGTVEEGRCIHWQILELGLESNVIIGSALVDMYAKCGSMNEAHNVFQRLPNRNSVTWGSIITGYAQAGEGQLALECYKVMQLKSIQPDRVAFLGSLKACSILNALERGRCIHVEIIESRLYFDVAVGSTLIDMYAKCRSLEDALVVFGELPVRNIVTWNAIITGFSENDEGFLALQCFEAMQYEDVKPSEVTFLSILKACGSLGAIGHSRHMHEQINGSIVELETKLGNTLVDTYAKCGCMEEAHGVFHYLLNPNVVSWSALIAGYAQLGNIELVVNCFTDLQHSGVRPNDITFTNILMAFSRAGLVAEGLWFFRSIKEHGLKQNLCHVTCMVDLLGHAGCFNDADDVIKSCNEPDVYLWTTLLSACSMHSNVQLGAKCFAEIVRLDNLSGPAYVLMSNMCASSFDMENACQIERLRICRLAGVTPLNIE